MASRNYARDYVIHAHGLGVACNNPRRRDRVSSELRTDVTCKLCLRALTAHDRAFQRKARAQLTRKGPLIVRRGRAFEAADALGEAAVVAILVEEGHNERAARIAASFGVTR